MFAYSITACIKMDPKTWISGGGEYLKDKQGSLAGAEAESLLAYGVDEKI